MPAPPCSTPPAVPAGSVQAVVSAAPLCVVPDTNVLLSLYVFADSRFAPLRRQIDSGRWRALTSAACLDEFRRVLGYPEFALDGTAQQRALDAWCAQAVCLAVPVPGPGVLPRCRDPDDQKFLELAHAGGAAWLITADKALLALARRPQLAQRLGIITPEQALAELV